MARALETLVTQSVLDRLIGGEDWPTTRTASLHLLKDAMRRDLEWLLNTRRPQGDGMAGLPLAERSVIAYGLLETSSLSQSSSTDRRRLQLAVQHCVEVFEPRLEQVVVSLVDDESAHRKLRFHIQARIRLDPMPEEISFDTVLDLTSGEYAVI